MRRPQWIAALLFAMLVAAGFAWLGQWQLGFAIQAEDDAAVSTEVARPIDALTDAGMPVDDTAAGMVTELSGTLVPGDFRIVEQRRQGDATGAWVTGHLRGERGSLAVAVGWAESVPNAERAIAQLEEQLAEPSTELFVEGRYMPSDGAVEPKPDEDVGRIVSMAPAQLVNLWQPFEGLPYAGFLVLHPAADGQALDAAALEALGLEPIDSVPPLPVEKVNWLNLFYAVEWVVFAGFAIFFWYRLARDAWEKEHELKLLAASEAGTGPASDTQAPGR